MSLKISHIHTCTYPLSHDIYIASVMLTLPQTFEGENLGFVPSVNVFSMDICGVMMHHTSPTKHI